MTTTAPATDLRIYLQDARDSLLLKLDALSEYDVRRPLTPTGTNLLGLVKHLTGAEAIYFGEAFGRPLPGAQPLWITGAAEPNADLWATPDESREHLIDGYRRACAHSDETLDTLPLHTVGRIPWPPHPELTLHRVLIHMIAESHRHVGHADVVRELVDGSVGQRSEGDNMAPGDGAWWEQYRSRVEAAARKAAGQ
ncbi:putative damage-inducible protein DinB [Streptomyces sp. SAI-208]|uniref:DinB family protein n=1 Tax=Streptomyces sp. SAI-208 TaxID=2940550 RepID=UPI0024767BF2|nr:DinB family protein [Streptomyces sp. SAI-208]MDH6609764.1 putative damage-inducible protein DinB [Streptomyces sp. SAI-208]